MKDEIKEILDYFNKYVNDKYETYTVVDNNTKYLKILLDYITNLQEENERLKENAIHNDKVVDKARWNEMLYKGRIDKATEYLTSYESISTIQGLDKIEQNKTLDENTMNIMVNRYLDVHDKLLNILQIEKI